MRISIVLLSYIFLHEKSVSLDSSILYRIAAYCTPSFVCIYILYLYIDSDIVLSTDVDILSILFVEVIIL